MSITKQTKTNEEGEENLLSVSFFSIKDCPFDYFFFKQERKKDLKEVDKKGSESEQDKETRQGCSRALGVLVDTNLFRIDE